MNEDADFVEGNMARLLDECREKFYFFDEIWDHVNNQIDTSKCFSITKQKKNRILKTFLKNVFE